MMESPAPPDADRIDKNLRAISAVENGWRLPALPDFVKLDLATASPTPLGASNFLYGLQQSIDPNEQHQLVTPEADPLDQLTLPNGQPASTLGRKPASVMDVVRDQWAGWTSQAPPQTIDANAVQTFKIKAIEHGYLQKPENGQVDDSWSPELSSVRNQMLFDQMNNRYSGERPGATSFGRVMDIFNDWGSPSGLVRAAVDLDLLPDIGNVQKEFQTWGDKFRKISEASNPLEFTTNLFDALTGPVDDIVVPVVNDVLLITGVSEAFAFGRAALAAKEGIAGVAAVEGLYDAGRATQEVSRVGKLLSPFRSASTAADVARMSEPGFLASKLQQTALSPLGDAMAAWRNLPVTQIAKKGVQTGMRLGLVSQVEHNWLPGYQGGVNLGQTDAGQNVQHWTQNPLVMGVGEALLTPYTIFEPGSLTGAVKAVGRHALDVVNRSTAPLAAIGRGVELENEGGALARGWNNQVARRLQKLHFESVSDNQALTLAYHSAMGQHIADEGQRLALLGDTDAIAAHADRAQTYTQLAHREGVKSALKFWTGLSDEDLGAAMSYTTLAASIDHAASVAAGGDRAVSGWWERYYTFRNKMVAQLRNIDEGDHPGILTALAANSSNSRMEFAKKYKLLFESLDENDLAAAVAKHNQMAPEMLTNLMSSDNVNPESLTSYLASNNVLRTFGNWSKFSNIEHQIQTIQHDGLFLDARIASATGPSGGRLNVVPETRTPPNPAPGSKVLPLTTDTWWRDVLSGNSDLSYMDWVTKGIFSPLARHVDPSMGKLTVQLLESATKQELLSKAAEVRSLRRVNDLVAKLRRTGDGDVIFNEVAKAGSIGKQQALHYIDSLDHEALAVRGTSLSHAKAVQSYMDRQGLSWGDVEDAVRTRMQTLDTDPTWATRYGIDTVSRQGQTAMDTVASLKTKEKALQKLANRTAAEIDTPDWLESIKAVHGEGSAEHTSAQSLVDGLGRDGYRLVHGPEFMMPSDLRATLPMADATSDHLRTATLGNFFQRRSRDVMYQAEIRQRTEALQHYVGRVMEYKARNPQADIGLLEQMHLGAVKDGRFIPSVDSSDWGVLTDDVMNLLRNAKDAANRDLEDAMQNRGWLGKRLGALSFARSPKNYADMANDYGRLTNSLAGTYGQDGARAMFQAVRGARSTHFKDMGLYAIEANLRAKPQAVSMLQVLGGSRAGEKLTFARKLPARLVGGVVGYEVGSEAGGPEGGLAGGLAGAVVGGAGIRKGAQMASQAIEHSDWLRYAYLADPLVRARDFFRFTISPFFDLSRYTEAATLSNMSKMPEFADEAGNVVKPILRANQAPSALKRQMLKEAIASGTEPGLARAKVGADWQEIRSSWNRASRGDFDPDSMESLAHVVHDYGIMGFNPTDWMASSYAQLMKQARQHIADPDALEAYSQKAYEAVKGIYTYGTTGRSAAEMSANFVLFPFSFQKKMLTTGAKFVADDWSRAVMIHDGYKAYEALDEKFNLKEFWRDHLPVLEELQRLNQFAYGIGPGRLGGINGPFITPVLNMFGPQGFNIKNAADADQLQTLLRRTLPVYNDINVMTQDLKDQGHVLFSPSHQTYSADAADGYEKWNSYKKAMADALKTRGYKWSQLGSKKELAGINLEIKNYKAQLHEDHPGWADAQLRASHNADVKNLELGDRLVRGQLDAVTNTASLDSQVYGFDQIVKGFSSALRTKGVDMDADPDMVPPEVTSAIRDVAIEMAQEDPRFRLQYKKFYESKFGPIERDLL